ncbi:MAG: 2-oxoglutarate dehydrogenase complex dihydrolipoyllysine-residue succinyltransferase [Chloroflexi bacterium]|nr:2-oxoglutarate dehydrogenase complex dihydrolipoyllysine-residue succinyltransferase [Chloroflexota bacterium]
MATRVVVPELGESVIEATVGTWFKQEGDTVQAGEVLVSLETDKVDVEVGAETAGVLSRIERHSGEDVSIGDVLAVIEPGGDGAAAAPEEPAAEEPAAKEAAGEAPAADAPAEPAPTQSRAPEQAPSEAVTPVARRMADEAGVDLKQVSGSGPAGRVTKRDVERHLQGAKAPAPPQPAAPAPEPAATPTADGREERVRMSRRRRTIARRLVEAQQTAAILTTFNEVDMSAVIDVRQRRRESFEKRHGVRLGFMSFFVKAAIGALKAFPRLNAEIQGDDIVLKHYYDIGMAVGAEEGLVVPVLRDADRMSFADIERKIREYVQQVQDGSLSLEDLRGGTFTITNGGVFGSLLSTPILNPPQVGILGLHKIEERPIALNGEVVIRPMMYVALSYDHRIVDGSEAVQFLVRVKELIEDPETLLLEG